MGTQGVPKLMFKNFNGTVRDLSHIVVILIKYYYGFGATIIRARLCGKVNGRYISITFLSTQYTPCVSSAVPLPCVYYVGTHLFAYNHVLYREGWSSDVSL